MKPCHPALIASIFIALQTEMTAAQTPFKTLNYLYSIAGQKTIVGQHNRDWYPQIGAIAGHDPALWDEDFCFFPAGGTSSMNEWYGILEQEALTQWENGNMVGLMWHACPPTQSTPCEWSGGVVSELTDAEWLDRITDGGTLNRAWKERMDMIVPSLQFLKEHGVEVLWRPLHEMNQSVFWWAGRTGPNGTARLYQITHDYLVKEKGLTNLIWVWSTQDLSTDLAQYSPGSEYFDIAAIDIYDGSGYTADKYALMQSIAGGKPIAVAECQKLPTPAELAAQPKWSYVTGWAELITPNNSNQEIQSLYTASNTVNADAMPSWDNFWIPDNIAKGKPVVASGSQDSAHKPSYLVDGDATTRWSSAYEDGQTVVVDLQDTFMIDTVALRWEVAFAKSYRIDISTDSMNWTNVYENDDGNGVSDFVNIISERGPTSGRFVKVTGTTRATEYGISLWELEVYGAPSDVTKIDGNRIAASAGSLGGIWKNGCGGFVIKTGGAGNSVSQISVYTADGTRMWHSETSVAQLTIGRKEMGSSGVAFVTIENAGKSASYRIIAGGR